MGRTDTGVSRPRYSLRDIVSTAQEASRLRLGSVDELWLIPFQLDRIVTALGPRTKLEFTMAAQRGPFSIDVDLTAYEIMPNRAEASLVGSGSPSLPFQPDLSDDEANALRCLAVLLDADVEDLFVLAVDQFTAREAGAVAQELARHHDSRTQAIAELALASEIQCLLPSGDTEACVTKYATARCTRCNEFLRLPPDAG